MKRLSMSEHDGGSPITHADKILCRYGIASRAREVVVRQPVKPFLTAAKHLQVLCTQRKRKRKIIGVMPTLPSGKRQPLGLDLIVDLDAVQIVVNGERS